MRAALGEVTSRFGSELELRVAFGESVFGESGLLENESTFFGMNNVTRRSCAVPAGARHAKHVNRLWQRTGRGSARDGARGLSCTSTL